MPQRPKKAEQFQKYSIEWKKLRDEKVIEKRMRQEEDAREKSKTRPLNSDSRKYQHLRADYRGPVSGYYHQV